MRALITLSALVFATGLTACDEVDSDLERALVGAAIGCAAGEVLVNGRCIERAVVGAGVSVLTD